MHYCRRCPIEYRLSSSDRPWHCQISIRHKSSDSDPGAEEPFGPSICNRDGVEEMVCRAQLAILNPDLPASAFETFDVKSLQPGEKPPGSSTQLSFSNDVVSVDISGPDLPELCIVDVPGM